ncbi:aldose epimerase [Sphingomonas sp. Leaf33]|uniref:aldose 1-epimerase family protein n=1 Tax=Sphingomonas sp. Leaf33 TaxID=1736215 RepID=UPI0006F4DAD1|nr:aldose 1-epimerase family protein [Sphingomonas sp. Leaf33]KQN19473.1 aldose epimerase [Sphingomonas sp. Leaf33]
MADWISFGSEALRAEVNPHGAELSSLIDSDGAELMTNADPAYWTGRAPILFPIVGAVAENRYRLDGREYQLAKHGFARRSMFEVVGVDDDRATFRLEASEATRAAYPFDFALTVDFRIVEATLTITTTLANSGIRDLPASFGYHPAFAWPLPYGGAKTDHHMVFDTPEPGAISELSPDGLIAGKRASPLDGPVLTLRDDLFADDALIWSPVESRGLTYGVEGQPGLRIEWDAPELGIWTKPGASYVCVEPWWGEADPAGFSGEIWEKPGILRVAPGEHRIFTMSVTLTA